MVDPFWGIEIDENIKKSEWIGNIDNAKRFGLHVFNKKQQEVIQKHLNDWWARYVTSFRGKE